MRLQTYVDMTFFHIFLRRVRFFILDKYSLLQNVIQPEFIKLIAYVIIAIGALLFLISFLGYCGALVESQCMLTTVSIILLDLTSLLFSTDLIQRTVKFVNNLTYCSLVLKMRH